MSWFMLTPNLRGSGLIRILEKCNLRRRCRLHCQQALKKELTGPLFTISLRDLRGTWKFSCALSLSSVLVALRITSFNRTNNVGGIWSNVSDDGSATVGWEVLIEQTIANGASRRSLATSCWVEVKETLQDPSENLIQPPTLAGCSPNLYDWTRTEETESRQSRLVPPKWDESFISQGLIPQDINRTLLGSLPGRSDTCRHFFTTIYAEKTSLNIGIDFLGAGRMVGDGVDQVDATDKSRDCWRGNTSEVRHEVMARPSGVLSSLPASS
ncbi:hypothetical protein EDD85DRAFT_789613 [Armillaria nabsnona]|nr:hypothetical protein EDD85DRAFT_789613 [Armillaria nabsnona]